MIVTVPLVPTLELQPDLMRARLELVDAVRERPIATRTVETPSALPYAFLDEGDVSHVDELVLVTPDERGRHTSYNFV